MSADLLTTARDMIAMIDAEPAEHRDRLEHACNMLLEARCYPTERKEIRTILYRECLATHPNASPAERAEAARGTHDEWIAQLNALLMSTTKGGA